MATLPDEHAYGGHTLQYVTGQEVAPTPSNAHKNPYCTVSHWSGVKLHTVQSVTGHVETHVALREGQTVQSVTSQELTTVAPNVRAKWSKAQTVQSPHMHTTSSKPLSATEQIHW